MESTVRWFKEWQEANRRKIAYEKVGIGVPYGVDPDINVYKLFAESLRRFLALRLH